MLRLLLAMVLVGSSLAGGHNDPPPPERPDELVAAQAARASFRTAHIEWTMDEATTGRRFFTSRFAGDDHLLVLHGDTQGAVMPDRVGQPGAYSEVRQLLKEGQQWVYLQDTASVAVKRESEMIPMLDLRGVGFLPHYTSDQGLSAAFFSDPDIQGYEALSDSKALLITASFTHGRAVRWWLDPGHQFNPVRCAMYMDEAFRGQTLTSYGVYDKVRFPRRVEYQDAEHELVRSIEILFAAFDRPWHPAELGPQHLGIVPGHAVDTKDLGIAAVWDGAQVVARDTFVERVQKGQADASAFAGLVQRVRDEGGPGMRPVRLADFDEDLLKRTPVLWESYVRAFITEKRLRLDRIRDAWRILDTAQRDVHLYVEKNAREFDRLQAARAAAAVDDLEEGQRKQQQRAADQLENALFAPIVEIYEDKLSGSLAAMAGH